MTALLDKGATATVPAFDPAAWLASWQAHGGTVLLTGERLWLGRAAPVDTKAAKVLNALKEVLTHARSLKCADWPPEGKYGGVRAMITRIVIAAAAITSLVGIGILLVMAFQHNAGAAYLGVLLFGLGRASRIALAIHGDG